MNSNIPQQSLSAFAFGGNTQSSSNVFGCPNVPQQLRQAFPKLFENSQPQYSPFPVSSNSSGESQIREDKDHIFVVIPKELAKKKITITVNVR